MYRSTLSTIAALVLPLSAAGCGSQEMMNGPDGVRGATTMVAAVTPAGGATSASTSGPVTIRFSQGMGAGMEQFVDLHEGDVAGPLVAMSCTWSSDRATLACTPAAPLKSGTRYAVHVGAGMMDANGLPLDLSQMPMGGQWAFPATMGSHGGMSWSMMGSGWRGGNASYGMVFTFTTA